MAVSSSAVTQAGAGSDQLSLASAVDLLIRNRPYPRSMTGAALSLDALRQRVADDDGHLPNGRAECVDAAAWAAFLGELRHSGWHVRRGDDPSHDWPLTEAAAAAHDGLTLHVQASDTVRVNVFPSWGTDSIWFDFNIREMQRQQDADALMAFLRLLGRSAHRPVLLSYEGADEMVFARYEPAQDALVWSDEADG